MSNLKKLSFVSLMLICALFIGLFAYPQTATAQQIHIVNGQIVESAVLSPDSDYKTVEYVNGAARLNDHANGYSITFPADMYVDASLSKVVTTLQNNDTVVEIYYDNFTENTNTRNVNDYIFYSNLFLRNRTDHNLLLEKNITLDNHPVHILNWRRAPLVLTPNDKNNYLSAEIVKNQKEVYTILIKSSQDAGQFMPIIESFRIIPQYGEAKINTRWAKPQRFNQNQEIMSFYSQYFSDEAALKWGIYEFSVNNDYNYLNNLENSMGGKFDFILWYKSMSTPFPADVVNDAYNNGKYVELTLHTELANQSNQSIMYAILNGDYDAFFIQYADELKAFGRPVLFRLNNEMNGDWCNWSALHFSKDTEIFKLVWRHIYNIFRNHQADNVLWVWNPNDRSFPDFKWNHPLMYFPGAEYVDIIGLTGYNTGTYYPDEPWREFSAIYDPLYSDYSQWFDYPMMITEFACNSIGGDKIRWIADMKRDISKYPRIKAAVWFNGIDYDADMNPARLYRIDENQQTIAAFAQVFDSYGLSYLELVRP